MKVYSVYCKSSYRRLETVTEYEAKKIFALLLDTGFNFKFSEDFDGKEFYYQFDILEIKILHMPEIWDCLLQDIKGIS